MKPNICSFPRAGLIRSTPFTNPSGRLALLAAAMAVLVVSGLSARAECPAVEVASGLQHPLGVALSNQRNLIVSETGTGAPGSGRISIVDREGNRRTLLDGLPSGINDVGEPSGPAGVFMRGRTLYVVIGVGDVAVAGPFPGTSLPNPNPPSSPLFSSLLAVHFSAAVEKCTEGLSLAPEDQQALANGNRVTLSNGSRDQAAIELIANFPDFTPNPLPTVPGNVRLSNPFDLVVVDDQAYVTDGGQNAVRHVDVSTGASAILATFPTIPNPYFNPTPPPPGIGGPVIEAVPTGIRCFDGLLLVTLFRGAPFPPGASQVQAIDPATGEQAPLITGLKTAIDVLPVGPCGGPRRGNRHRRVDGGDFLVLEHASTGLFFGSPGSLLAFDQPDDEPVARADCLVRPTSMALDERSGLVYVTEFGGRLVAITLDP